MEEEGGGWDSDGLGYDTPGDEADGDELMQGAVPEDLGPLRDKPASAAAMRPRGQYGRAQAMRKPIGPAANVHVAARRLRDLAGPPLRTVVQFGAVGGRSGSALQSFMVLQRHGHPAVEERAHGRPPGVAGDGAGHDSKGIVALKPQAVDIATDGGYAVVMAVRECQGECVHVTPAELGSKDAWGPFVQVHVPSMPVKDRDAALTLFRRAARLAAGCNGEGVEWGTSVLVAVRRAERTGEAKTLVFLHDGCPAGLGALISQCDCSTHAGAGSVTTTCPRALPRAGGRLCGWCAAWRRSMPCAPTCTAGSTTAPCLPTPTRSLPRSWGG